MSIFKFKNYNMKKEEFEEIIKPLWLLEEHQREFLISALRGNFNQWHIKAMEAKMESVMIRVHRQVKVYEEAEKNGTLRPLPNQIE